MESHILKRLYSIKDYIISEFCINFKKDKWKLQAQLEKISHDMDSNPLPGAKRTIERPPAL